MTDWYTDDRHSKTYGDITVVSQQKDGETAHLVTFPSGNQVRVLPDGRSGQMRSRAVRHVLEKVERLRGVPGDLREDFVVGGFARALLVWEELLVPDSTVTVDEWLDSWFELFGVEDVAYARKSLLGDLAEDGWEIRRAE